MTPVPITYHDHPPTPQTSTSKNILTPVNLSTWTHSSSATKHFYITISKNTPHTSPVKPISVPITKPSPPPTEPRPDIAPAPAQTSSRSSQTSSTPTTSSIGIIKKRKTVYKPFNPSVHHITLRPMLEPILLRCLPSTSSSPSDPDSGDSRLNHSSTKIQIQLNGKPTYSFHPYSRLTDGANTRSSNPSPREIKRREKAEEERVRLKKENAAAARNVKKKGKKGRGGSRVVEPPVSTVTTGTGAGTGSGNGNGNGGTNGPSNGNGNGNKKRSRSISPSKSKPNPDETATSHLPLPALKGGMKRTRSGGLSIATNLSLVNSQTSLGSPLRAVTGPEDPESGPSPSGVDKPETDQATHGGEEDDSEREKKRSKVVKENENEKANEKGNEGGKRNAVSHSPSSGVPSLPSVGGNSIGVEGGTEKKRRGSHHLSTGSGTLRSGLGVGGGGGGEDMRRVVSVGAEGRSRRNLVIPGRLRDYDIRAGAGVV